ncbi:MAG TPA: excisionase family DNA-binding protein [Chloroflexota bacterium]|nr:excisionase family DNA-binding protein [Chloroflexota bacterium]
MFESGRNTGSRDTPLLLSVDEAVLELGIKRTMFFAELGAGRIRSFKVGRRRLIPRAALQEWIDDRVAEGESEPDESPSVTSTTSNIPLSDKRAVARGNEVRWDAEEGCWASQV